VHLPWSCVGFQPKPSIYRFFLPLSLQVKSLGSIGQVVEKCLSDSVILAFAILWSTPGRNIFRSLANFSLATGVCPREILESLRTVALRLYVCHTRTLGIS
jgi:hypothetical protein